uniref:Winged helix-turn-helix domain-containing protein n=1 Tax=Tetranychus urticae TaxID=32264 RepID=T1KSA9_TETUR
MDSEEEEKILMTTTRPAAGHTILKIERLTAAQLDENGAMHVGGGDNKGIIINRPGVTVKSDLDGKVAHLSLSFKVFLVNSSTTNVHVEEHRSLKFWFKEGITENDQLMTAQEFFRDLVNPSDFPRDYVGFIMKVIKLLQRKYLTIRQVQLDMKQSEEKSELPSRPVSVDEAALGSLVELTQARVLEIIESSYPNVVTLEDIVKTTNSTEEEVNFHITDLISKNIIEPMDNLGFIRVNRNDTQVKMVKQMPKVQKSQQPTIAIITAQYCEKLAVDAMIEDKDTYVKYKTEGESNVYTLGTIGKHRVVSTKLPTIGTTRGAMIAAGNTTTRLLGTFQHVEHVFLVGLGGGVAHYTDFSKHVRLGDVVVSIPPPTTSNSPTHKPYIYIHCEKITSLAAEEKVNGMNGDDSADGFTFRTWGPANLELQELSQKLLKEGTSDESKRTWETNLITGIETLKCHETDFTRPAPETDKLFMALGAKDVLEVIHPEVPEGVHDPRTKGMPMIHFGAIASGRSAVRDDQVRAEIATKFGVYAFDSEFDTVVESIHGNRKEKYIFIRGICDYKDGTRKKEWQPFSALAAASFMKSMIMTLPLTRVKLTNLLRNNQNDHHLKPSSNNHKHIIWILHSGLLAHAKCLTTEATETNQRQKIEAIGQPEFS